MGISKVLWVCVLRCDIFELFGFGVQDEQALNYLWISVLGMESLNYLGVGGVFVQRVGPLNCSCIHK